jgi:hypothetical protein
LPLRRTPERAPHDSLRQPHDLVPPRKTREHGALGLAPPPQTPLPLLSTPEPPPLDPLPRRLDAVPLPQGRERRRQTRAHRPLM